MLEDSMKIELHKQAGVRALFQAGTFLLALSACASVAAAQETRADALAQEREAKAQATNASQPAQPGRMERMFSWAETKADGASGARDGFYPEMGGMITG